MRLTLQMIPSMVILQESVVALHERIEQERGHYYVLEKHANTFTRSPNTLYITSTMRDDCRQPCP